jgi:hypothetical protein
MSTLWKSQYLIVSNVMSLIIECNNIRNILEEI